jgi:hypothetical protein
VRLVEHHAFFSLTSTTRLPAAILPSRIGCRRPCRRGRGAVRVRTDDRRADRNDRPAPPRHRERAVEAIMVLQVMFAYLDALTEQPTADPIRDGLQYLRAFVDRSPSPPSPAMTTMPTIELSSPLDPVPFKSTMLKSAAGSLEGSSSTGEEQHRVQETASVQATIRADQVPLPCSRTLLAFFGGSTEARQ